MWPSGAVFTPFYSVHNSDQHKQMATSPSSLRGSACSYVSKRRACSMPSAIHAPPHLLFYMFLPAPAASSSNAPCLRTCVVVVVSRCTERCVCGQHMSIVLVGVAFGRRPGLPGQLKGGWQTAQFNAHTNRVLNPLLLLAPSLGVWLSTFAGGAIDAVVVSLNLPRKPPPKDLDKGRNTVTTVAVSLCITDICT